MSPPHVLQVIGLCSSLVCSSLAIAQEKKLPNKRQQREAASKRLLATIAEFDKLDSLKAIGELK